MVSSTTPALDGATVPCWKYTRIPDFSASHWRPSGTLTNVPADVAEHWYRHGWVTVEEAKAAAKPKAEPKAEPTGEKK